MDGRLLALSALIAFMVGLGKGGLGGAFAGIITPLVSLILPVREAVVLVMPYLMVGDWFAVRAYWGGWDVPLLKRLFPLALLSVLAGGYLLANLPASILRPLLGTLALLIGAYKLGEGWFIRRHYQPQGWHAVLVGGVTGLGSALASAGGPILSAYLLLRRTPPQPFIATTALFFAVINLVRLPTFYAAGLLRLDDLLWVGLFIPLVWAGIEAGRWLIKRIQPAQFERLMTAILLVAGILLWM